VLCSGTSLQSRTTECRHDETSPLPSDWESTVTYLLASSRQLHTIFPVHDTRRFYDGKARHLVQSLAYYKYVGPHYCQAKMYAGRVVCCLRWVRASMPTAQTDRRTDTRSLHYAFRYIRDHRNKTYKFLIEMEFLTGWYFGDKSIN